MKMSEAFPSRYMKAGVDVEEDGQRVLTISDVRLETIGQGAQAAQKNGRLFLNVLLTWMVTQFRNLSKD